MKDSVASEIADQLDKVSAYIDAPLLTKIQKVSVIDFLISEFSNIDVDELGTAVKMVLAERLTTSKDISYITKQSVGWWGTILSAYQKYKREKRSAPPSFDPNVKQLQERNQSQIDKEFYDGLIDWYARTGSFPELGWNYTAARRHAKAKGILNVTKKDKDLVHRIARGYSNSCWKFDSVRELSQSHYDYAVMRIHITRLNKEDE